MRFDLDSYREIADSLTRNKSRSFLTGFGIFWGLFMLLFLIGGGKGVKSMLSANFEGFASNAAIMVSQNTSLPYKGMQEGRYWNLRLGDVERLRTLIPELDVVSPQLSRWGVNAVYGDLSSSCSMKGVRADYSKVEAPSLKYGRYINEVDVEQERKVCVIGKRVYEELFPDGGDPCGQYIAVGGVYFRIVGVDFNASNISINGNSSQSTVVPISVAQKLYNYGDVVEIICVTAKSGVQMTSLEGRIRQVLARNHMFDPEDEPALLVLNTEQIFNLVDALFRGVNFLIWLIGLGTLLAGAIGVSNIMMVTVRERTTEIGIRRAIGATPREILSQIMLESVTLTLVAGSAGIVFSVAMLSLLGMITGRTDTFQIDFSTAVVAALMLTLLGIAAGMAPASRAMNIKPVDAMRDE